MLLLNIFLMLAWVALNGKYTLAQLVFGFVLGYLTLWLMVRTVGGSGYFARTWKIVDLFLFFAWDLTKSNLRVMYEIITPGHHMHPAIIAVPLDIKSDAAITLLANMITLTPGTLSLDVSSDRSVLYIHSMFVTSIEEARETIKTGFERRILEVLD